MAPALGYAAKLALGTTSAVDQPLDFLNESVQLQENFLDPAGLRGTRSHASERVRRNTRLVQGGVTMTPTPLELDRILPWILGGTKQGDNTITVAETVPDRYVSIDRIAKVFLYSGVKVNSATFSASQGGFLTVSLNLAGIDETVNNAGTHPSLTLDADTPYILSDCILTVGGTAYQFSAWELTVDNALDLNRFLNTSTLTAITSTDRVCQTRLTGPWGDLTALYGLAQGGVAVTATFTQGTKSCLFSTPAVQAPKNSPLVTGRSEIDLTVSGFARKVGTTPEVTVTNDST